MTSDAIEVHLHGQAIGRVEQRPQGAVWIASDHALDHYGIGSTVLSLALPLDSAPASVAATEAFFGGLLPEGDRLTALLSDGRGLRRDRKGDARGRARPTPPTPLRVV